MYRGKFPNKLAGAGNLRSNLRNYLEKGDLGVDKFYRLIKNVSKTLANFFTSTSDSVSHHHLPKDIHPDDLIGRQNEFTYKEMASFTYNTVYFTGFHIRYNASSVTLLMHMHTHVHTHTHTHTHTIAPTYTGAGPIQGSVAANDRQEK